MTNHTYPRLAWLTGHSLIASKNSLAVVVPGAMRALAQVRPLSGEVRLEGSDGDSYLVWDLDNQQHHDGEPLAEFVWQFLELANATEAEILKFGQRFGPLGLHRTQDSSINTNEPQRESTAEWRAYSRALGALIGLSVHVRRGTSADHEVWITASEAFMVANDPEALSGDYRASLKSRFETNALYIALAEDHSPGRDIGPQIMFSRLVTDLLATSDLRPGLVTDLSGASRIALALPAEITLTNEGAVYWRIHRLSDALLCATLDAISSEFIHLCSICGKAYERYTEKKPRYDRRNFCSNSCRHEAEREEKRNYARRKYAERRVATSKSNS